MFKVQFSVALAVIFYLAQNQTPPANKKMVILAELPWRRECQLGESEGKPDETYMNRREFNRKERYIQFWRSPIASFGESTVNWRSETPNQGFRFFDGQFASSEKQRPMPHTRIQDELHGKRKSATPALAPIPPHKSAKSPKIHAFLRHGGRCDYTQRKPRKFRATNFMTGLLPPIARAADHAALRYPRKS